MMKIASEILSAAKSIVDDLKVRPKVRFTFHRKDDTSRQDLAAVFKSVQDITVLIHGNEEVKTTVTRADTDKDMIVEVGFEDHDSEKDIVEYIVKMANRAADKAGLKVDVSTDLG